MFVVARPPASTRSVSVSVKALAVLYFVALTTLAALTFGSGTSAAAAASAAAASAASGDPAVLHQPSRLRLLRRRLNNQRSDCPTDSLYYCDNPSLIMSDPDVMCAMDTCKWDTSLLRSDREPAPCRSIVITNVSTLDDYLEPCLWWQMLYGDLATDSPGLLNGASTS
jgi:hypothetical protein